MDILNTFTSSMVAVVAVFVVHFLEQGRFRVIEGCLQRVEQSLLLAVGARPERNTS